MKELLDQSKSEWKFSDIVQRFKDEFLLEHSRLTKKSSSKVESKDSNRVYKDAHYLTKVLKWLTSHLETPGSNLTLEVLKNAYSFPP